jgi:hypothetical protein
LASLRGKERRNHSARFLREDALTEQVSGRGQPDDSRGDAHGQSGQPAYGDDQTTFAANPAPGGVGYSVPQQRQQIPDSKGFFAALFDFGFTSFVAPKVVKVLYVLIMIMTALSALLFTIIMLKANVGLGIMTLLIGAPLFFLIVMAIYRITLEFFIVFFRIAEDIQVLRQRGDLR